MTTVEKKTIRLGETKIKELLSLTELAEIEKKLVAEGIEHIMPKNTEYYGVRCRTCLELLPDLEHINYCPNCGQRIDWGKWNDADEMSVLRC